MLISAFMYAAVDSMLKTLKTDATLSQHVREFEINFSLFLRTLFLISGPTMKLPVALEMYHKEIKSFYYVWILCRHLGQDYSTCFSSICLKC